LTTHWKQFWIRQFQKFFPQNLATLADAFHKNPLCELHWIFLSSNEEKNPLPLMVLMIGCFGQMTLRGVEHP
jgi:hypothetical protein